MSHINFTPIISNNIKILLALIGAAILSGIINNITKKNRTKKDDAKVITGLIIGSTLFIIVFPKITILIILIVLTIFAIRKITNK